TGREADLVAALRTLLPPDTVAEFPSWETLPHERLSPRSDTVGRRLAVLRRLAHPREDDPETGPVSVVVAPIRSVLQPQVHGVGDLGPLAARADWVISAVPLTPATYGMFDTRFFGLLQPSAHFINVGRGATVVEADLVAALHRRWLAGAALDVFADEPLGEESPLWEVPGLLVSPHQSGDTVGWRDRLGEQFVDMYELWTHGEPLPNVVDKQRGYVPSEDLPTDNSGAVEGTSPG
ncbi:NAD(P)-dependent oxidoreductase, partial [Streptomyces sp. ZEA17I]|uniref:NAD(P)-dependent oxidoreductase n=1 Tax=Streptomyces sp. ZEA17I TaxID=2202516 RepID=UPI0028128B87